MPPVFDIKWYQNGKRVSTKKNHYHYYHITYTTLMTIKKMTKKQEMAKNSKGHATVEFTLRVRTTKKHAENYGTVSDYRSWVP